MYFYARALQILRQGGWLSFITSNSFVKRRYGLALQRHLATALELKSVIDFGETAIFEATVEPYVLVGRKDGERGHGDHLLAHNVYPSLARRSGRTTNVEQVREELVDLNALLSEDVSRLPQDYFVSVGWRIEDELVLRLLERLVNHGTPLADFARGQIYMGVKTGLNEAFVINRDRRDELIATDARSAELIKPWLRGRDIKRWRVEPADLFVIFTSRGVELDRYPAIEQHLNGFRNRLEKRATSHLHPWYELQQPQEGAWPDFEDPKTLWPNMARTIRFAFDREGMFFNDKVYAWVKAPKWSVAVLNSEVARFVLALGLRGHWRLASAEKSLHHSSRR